MSDIIERPDIVDDEHLIYLDELRESGETNMFGARKYLNRNFSELSGKEGNSILKYWMKTFGDKTR